MKTTTTRMTGLENPTEEMKEDESSSSYVYTYIVEGRENKEIEVNGVDNVNNNNGEGKNDLSSKFNNKKGNKKIKR